MTSPGSAAVSSEPQRYPLDRVSAALKLAVVVARALGRVASDADDATLVAALGQEIVPALGDLCVLFLQDEAGVCRVAETYPARNGTARRLRTYLTERPDALAGYAALIGQRRPVVTGSTAPGADQDGQSLGLLERQRVLEALGVSAELAVPLDGGTLDGAGVLAIWAANQTRQYDEHDLALGEVLAALLGGRRLAQMMARHSAALRQQVEQAASAGRELAHRLNNDLTMPVGVVELLLDRGSIAPELQEMLQAASKDLTSLEQHVRTFHEIMRAQSDVGGPVTRTS